MNCFRKKRSDSWDPNSPRVSSLEIEMDYDHLEKKKQEKRPVFAKRIYALHGLRVWHLVVFCIMLLAMIAQVVVISEKNKKIESLKKSKNQTNENETQNLQRDIKRHLKNKILLEERLKVCYDDLKKFQDENRGTVDRFIDFRDLRNIKREFYDKLTESNQREMINQGVHFQAELHIEREHPEEGVPGFEHMESMLEFLYHLGRFDVNKVPIPRWMRIDARDLHVVVRMESIVSSFVDTMLKFAKNITLLANSMKRIYDTQKDAEMFGFRHDPDPSEHSQLQTFIADHENTWGLAGMFCDMNASI